MPIYNFNMKWEGLGPEQDTGRIPGAFSFPIYLSGERRRPVLGRHRLRVGEPLVAAIYN